MNRDYATLRVSPDSRCCDITCLTLLRGHCSHLVLFQAQEDEEPVCQTSISLVVNRTCGIKKTEKATRSQ